MGAAYIIMRGGSAVGTHMFWKRHGSRFLFAVEMEPRARECTAPIRGKLCRLRFDLKIQIQEGREGGGGKATPIYYRNNPQHKVAHKERNPRQKGHWISCPIPSSSSLRSKKDNPLCQIELHIFTFVYLHNIVLLSLIGYVPGKFPLQ